MMKRKPTSIDSLWDKSLKKQKRQIALTMFNKWQVQSDYEYKSLSWLKCEVNDKSLMEKLCCHVCRKYEGHIMGIKYFLWAWIEGSTNQKMSNVVDHAISE